MLCEFLSFDPFGLVIFALAVAALAPAPAPAPVEDADCLVFGDCLSIFSVLTDLSTLSTLIGLSFVIDSGDVKSEISIEEWDTGVTFSLLKVTTDDEKELIFSFGIELTLLLVSCNNLF